MLANHAEHPKKLVLLYASSFYKNLGILYVFDLLGTIKLYNGFIIFDSLEVFDFKYVTNFF